MRNILASLSYLVLISSPALGGEIFATDDHCVAWKAQKSMFFVKKETPVGKNCAIEVSFISLDDRHYKLELKAPLAEFDSGEPDRDKYVKELLKGEKRPVLLIETLPQTETAWQAIWTPGTHKVPSKIWIGDEAFPIDLDLSVDASRISGLHATQLSAIGVERPRAIMGFLLDVDDEMALYFHLQKDRIEDSEWISSIYPH